MKRVLLLSLVLFASVACGCQTPQSNCNSCSNGNGAYGGPSAPQVTYPYYTTRGPRDFFVDHPPSIGR